ncbi:DUF4944 domain-containing protein [Bacillus sp. B28]|nr:MULTISPECIES: DUF4944 domain-containing protein [Bacillus]UZD52053.1 YdhH/YoaO family protein [Bacillus halotolerans]WEY45715.1 DUF4944 domain-containing protein [Bacillus sp. B28]
MEYPNYIGESKDKHWEDVFAKNEDAPNEYSGNLYWISDQAKADNTYLKSLIVKKDDEVLLHSHTETPISDYSGAVFRDGSPKEKSVSFLAPIDETKLKGHDLIC